MLNRFATRHAVALITVMSTSLVACGSSPEVPTTMPSGRLSTGISAAPTADVRAVALSTTASHLGEYLAFALENSPETRASFERWRAARLSISSAARLPEPSISFGYYLRSVETKTGPQRYKLGISQTFPWPTKLSASADAMKEEAEAAALMVDANVLAVRRDVANAYWSLWLIDEEHRLKTEHDAVLEALAGSVRGRLQTGAATLADLNQIDLNIARHHDHRGMHEEAARRASATLRAVVGASADDAILIAADTPDSGLPQASDAQLAQRSLLHPNIARFSHLAASAQHRARAKGADRYPRFKVGLDLIGTGEATPSTVEESGKDAVIVSAGLSLPFWVGSYSDAERAARAASNAHLAMAQASVRDAEAMLAVALSNVRDAQRRIELYQRTLVPQSETTFLAVLGGYQTSRSNIASVIIAQRDLIELRLEHARARADWAKAWATLEFIVGTQLEVRGENHE